MYKYKARCVHVVDGDTMDFDVDLGFHLTNRIRVRLLDIDTPEIYGKDNDKVLGHKVKYFVERQLFDPDSECVGFVADEPVDVIIATTKTGSFGRWLATVTFEDGTNLTDRILKEFPELRELQ